jgi:hypothetical protein
MIEHQAEDLGSVEQALVDGLSLGYGFLNVRKILPPGI